MDTRQTLLALLRYLLAFLLSLAIYQIFFLWMTQYFSDGRFITSLALGLTGFSLTMLVDYRLSYSFVFPDAPRRKGNLARFFLVSLAGSALLVALFWFLADVVLMPTVPAEWTSLSLILVLLFPVVRKFVFCDREPKPHPVLHVVGTVFLMMVVAAGVCGVTALNAQIATLYLSPYEKESSTLTITADEAQERSGSFTVHTAMETIGAAKDGSAKGLDLVWDDGWFTQDPTVYNNDLSLVCASLSSLADKQFVGSDSTSSNSDLSELYTKLGFSNVVATSYDRRSTIEDNVVALSTGATDTVAYVLGSKKILGADGNPRTLVMLTVRGTHGAEWLSDFNVAGDSPEGWEDDHVGFADAAMVVLDGLNGYLSQYAESDVTLLVCGHSRGGAVSNLVAARIIQLALDSGYTAIPADQVYAYTFAAPGVTTKSEEDVCQDRYACIFNILVPSDVVPELPLRSWGYKRYGVDLEFPRSTDEGFEEADTAMRAYYLEHFGKECPADSTNDVKVAAAVAQISQELPTSEGLGSIRSMLSLAHMFLCDLDSLSVFCSHYPATYIAWTATAGALFASR